MWVTSKELGQKGTLFSMLLVVNDLIHLSMFAELVDHCE